MATPVELVADDNSNVKLKTNQTPTNVPKLTNNNWFNKDNWLPLLSNIFKSLKNKDPITIEAIIVITK